MALAARTRLGPYEIVAPIGAGGMGEVYKARDTKLDREVAIKVLPAAFAQDPERLARFEREAKVLAALNHPNIAQIYGFEESDGIRALAMELVPFKRWWGWWTAGYAARRCRGPRSWPPSCRACPAPFASDIPNPVSLALNTSPRICWKRSGFPSFRRAGLSVRLGRRIRDAAFPIKKPCWAGAHRIW